MRPEKGGGSTAVQPFAHWAGMLPLERSALHRSSQHAASANAARCMWHRTALRFLPQKAGPAEGALWNKKDNT